MSNHLKIQGPRPHRFHGLPLAGLLVASAALAGCGGGGDSGDSADSSEGGGNAIVTPGPAPACSDLAGLSLAFEGNSTIIAATLVTGGSLVTPEKQLISDLPGFCRVQGVSKPTADSIIRFEVWLPVDTWNGRFMSSGEGGFGGRINYSNDGLDGGLNEIVRRGYATASTDTGHVGTDTTWAIGHPEKVIDYAYRAKHLVTVAAKGLIAAYYGQPATRSYLNSCSNGGRQALMEVQRYPDDYDGVVAGVPWNFQSHSAAGWIWTAQALSQPGAAIPAAKLPAIRNAVVTSCDALDGLADGLIEDPRKCNFDSSMLLCQAADSNSCLTEPQLAALLKLYQGPSNPRTGEQIYPGYSPGSEAFWGALSPTRLPAFLSDWPVRTSPILSTAIPTGTTWRSTSTATWRSPTPQLALPATQWKRICRPPGTGA